MGINLSFGQNFVKTAFVVINSVLIWQTFHMTKCVIDIWAFCLPTDDQLYGVTINAIISWAHSRILKFIYCHQRRRGVSRKFWRPLLREVLDTLLDNEIQCNLQEFQCPVGHLFLMGCRFKALLHPKTKMVLFHFSFKSKRADYTNYLADFK